MKRLWSPWRFGYVSGERPAGCVFCSLQDEADGPGNLIVRREAHAFLILNRYPYNNGHCMVIPARHTEELADLSDDEAAGVWSLVGRVSDTLRGSLGAHGVNVGVNLGSASGGSIPHLHVHLVPRWSGDTNFMPVIGETKVMVETLDDTYRRFSEALAEWDA